MKMRAGLYIEPELKYKRFFIFEKFLLQLNKRSNRLPAFEPPLYAIHLP